MPVRAKFKVVRNDPQANGEGCRIVLEAVASGSAENESFFRYTPSGQLTMSIVNPAAAEMFVEGHEIYLDFSPANLPPEPAAEPIAQGETPPQVTPFQAACAEVQKAARDMQMFTGADLELCLAHCASIWGTIRYAGQPGTCEVAQK